MVPHRHPGGETQLSRLPPDRPSIKTKVLGSRLQGRRGCCPAGLTHLLPGLPPLSRERKHNSQNGIFPDERQRTCSQGIMREQDARSNALTSEKPLRTVGGGSTGNQRGVRDYTAVVQETGDHVF